MLNAYLFAKTRLLDVRDRFAALQADESGAAMIEYALLIGLVAVAAAAAIIPLSGHLSTIFNGASTKLTNAGG
ncbi:MAG: Flp family type IVb pilin [Phenylobacterium sp.]|nr:MAG: Flp family type IVb pilin [Phenylobacterium sp.]